MGLEVSRLGEDLMDLGAWTGEVLVEGATAHCCLYKGAVRAPKIPFFLAGNLERCLDLADNSFLQQCSLSIAHCTPATEEEQHVRVGASDRPPFAWEGQEFIFHTCKIQINFQQSSTRLPMP